jgi:hypothetical protein
MLTFSLTCEAGDPRVIYLWIVKKDTNNVTSMGIASFPESNELDQTNRIPFDITPG